MTASDGFQQARTLADEGEVVVAAGGVRDRGATVGRDVERRRVEATATVCSDRASPGVADADGVTGVAAAVDVANGDRTAARRGRRHAAIAGGGDVGCALAAKERVLDPGLGCRLRCTGKTHDSSGHGGAYAIVHVPLPHSIPAYAHSLLRSAPVTSRSEVRSMPNLQVNVHHRVLRCPPRLTTRGPTHPIGFHVPADDATTFGRQAVWRRPALATPCACIHSD